MPSKINYIFAYNNNYHFLGILNHNIFRNLQYNPYAIIYKKGYERRQGKEAKLKLTKFMNLSPSSLPQAWLKKIYSVIHGEY